MTETPEAKHNPAVAETSEVPGEGDAHESSDSTDSTAADKKKEAGLGLKDYAALLLSILSLSVASLGFYFTHLRPGKVKVSIGLDAHLYHPRDGGTAIYLPVHLLNETAAKGIVRKSFLTIETERGESYALRWARRARINEGGDYQYIATSEPFFVEGKSFSDDLFWFLWPKNERVPLVFSPGKYKFTLYVWTNSESEPSTIHSRFLVLSEVAANALAENRASGRATTWVKPFEYTYTVGIYGKTPLQPSWWRTLTEDNAE